MISQGQLCDNVITRVQHLVLTTYAARDELNSAAECIAGERMKKVCRKLAAHLGDCAAELNQVVVNHGSAPTQPDDVHGRVYGEVIALLERRHGSRAVKSEAERRLQHVEQEYQSLLESTDDLELQAMLRRHREHIDADEAVLRGIRETR